jgi:hypothetical protein
MHLMAFPSANLVIAKTIRNAFFPKRIFALVFNELGFGKFPIFRNRYFSTKFVRDSKKLTHRFSEKKNTFAL